jgi:hypothetical protein
MRLTTFVLLMLMLMLMSLTGCQEARNDMKSTATTDTATSDGNPPVPGCRVGVPSADPDLVTDHDCQTHVTHEGQRLAALVARNKHCACTPAAAVAAPPCSLRAYVARSAHLAPPATDGLRTKRKPGVREWRYADRQFLA